MMIECPHCHMETEHKVIDHINIEIPSCGQRYRICLSFV